MMLDTQDKRTGRALVISADAGQWARCRTVDGRKLYAVPSSIDPHKRYLTDARSCTCKGFEFSGDCKHRMAVAIHCALVRAVQSAPTKLERRWTCGMGGCPFTTPEVDTMTRHVQTTHGTAPKPAADIFDRFNGD